jgi:hypothetical protein
MAEIGQGVPRNVCQASGGYSLAYFEWRMLYQHGLKSQPLRSYLMSLFPLSSCPCVPHLHVRCHLVVDELIGPFVTEGLLTAFPAERAATPVGRRSSPGRNTTALHLIYKFTSCTILQSVLRKSLDWLWRSSCLATAFARNRRHEMNSYGASWTVLLSYRTIMEAFGK